MPDEIETMINKAVKESYKKGKKDEDIAKSVSFLETEEYILEQVKSATHATHATYATDTQFVLFDKKTRLTDTRERFVYRDIEYKPVVDELLNTDTVLLPSGIEEYETTEKLVEDIKNFLYEYIEVPPFYKVLLPYLVLFYWLFDKFPFIPYLHFVGLTTTGKTTAQEVVGSICYKPIDVSGSITLSPLFRTATTWRGTMLLDEFEPNGENYSEMLAFLKSGVGNKAVLRTEGDKTREVRVYIIKSPKIFTSERPITNAGLQSRTFVIQMQKTKKLVPLYRLPEEFLAQSLSLRNKLLLWRLRNYDKVNLKEIKYGFPELRSFDRRVQQVLTPIYYLADPEAKKEMVAFAQEQEAETKRERRESLEGDIFQIIAESYPEQPSLKTIAEKINSGRPGLRPIGEKKLASIVRGVLGFEIERIGHENISTIITEGKAEKLTELTEYFGNGVIPVAGVERVAGVATNGLEHNDNVKSATRLLDENEQRVAKKEETWTEPPEDLR